MKIFVLAFCILQVCLAQRAPARPAPIPAPKPTPKPVINAVRINADFKAAQAVSSKLAIYVSLVLSNNGKYNNIIYNEALHMYSTISNAIRSIGGSQQAEDAKAFLQRFLNDFAKLLNDAMTFGISLESSVAYILFNIYVDVLNNLNVFARSKSSGINSVTLSRVALPVNFNLHQGDHQQMLIQDYSQFFLTVKDSRAFKTVFINNYRLFSPAVVPTANEYLISSVRSLIGAISVVNRADAAAVNGALSTMGREFSDILTNIVQGGNSIEKIVWEVVQVALASILRSVNDLIVTA